MIIKSVNGKSPQIPEDCFVAENATIVGTIRTLDYGMQDFINKRMKEMVPDIAKAFRAEATIEIDKGYPITFNHLELTSQMLPTLQRIASKENVLEIDAITGDSEIAIITRGINDIVNSKNI
mgnify:CR=1 FL=1